MILLFLLVAATCQLSHSQKASPCPEIFSYEPRGTEQDRWYGVISLRTPEDLNGVWLHIILDRPAELLGNWFGEATSSDNQEYTIKNPKYNLEAGPPVSVRFFVKYNAATVIPSLKGLRLNGKNICSSREDQKTTTEATLHFSQLKPTESGNNRPNSNSNSNNRPSSNNNRPNNRPSVTSGGRDPDSFGSSSSSSSNNQGRPGGNSGTRPRDPSNSSHNQNNFNGGGRPNSGTRPNREPSTPSNSNSGTNGLTLGQTTTSVGGDFFPGDFAIQRPSQSRPPSRPSGSQSRPAECGTTAMRASPLISYGQNTTPGQWPWHAALYHSQGIQLMYTCGATLISESHVLTAAHCVAKPQTNRPINADNIMIYFGKHNIVKFGSEVQDREVEQIFIHPKYNFSLYFNDIAVLKLVRPVDITNFVRPCCLWDESSDLEHIINKQGTVVGWGFDENRQLSNSLMQAQMPVVSTVKCIYSNREFFSQFTFEKNYCAGFRNGTSVCNGDSGGGMVFPKAGTSGHNTVWQIRGLVSVGVALQGQGVCDTSHYIVFTDVAKHIDWIQQVMAQ